MQPQNHNDDGVKMQTAEIAGRAENFLLGERRVLRG
jgi:hypothetical protein